MLEFLPLNGSKSWGSLSRNEAQRSLDCEQYCRECGAASNEEICVIPL
jgi:hypothetical protein